RCCQQPQRFLQEKLQSKRSSGLAFRCSRPSTPPLTTGALRSNAPASSCPAPTEVRFDDARVGQNCFGSAIGDLFSMIEHKNAIRQTFYGFDHMLDNQYADSTLTDAPDHRDHFINFDDIQAGHDFITQKDLWTHCERFGELQTLAPWSAESIGALRAIFAEPDKLQLGASLLSCVG